MSGIPEEVLKKSAVKSDAYQSRNDATLASGGATSFDKERAQEANAKTIQTEETTNPITELIQDGMLNPVELQKLYLSGKISLDQLTFNLKVFNSVAADTIIRSGKHAAASSVDYKEQRLADYGDQKQSNKSVNGEKHQDDKQQQPKAKPQSVATAKAQAAEAKDDEKIRQEAKKQEQQLRSNEQRQTSIRISNVTQTEVEQKYRQIDRELKRRQEEEKHQKDVHDQLGQSASRIEKMMANIKASKGVKKLLSKMLESLKTRILQRTEAKSERQKTNQDSGTVTGSGKNTRSKTKTRRAGLRDRRKED